MNPAASVFVPKEVKKTDPLSFHPKGGWNPVFSQKDKEQCSDYYSYIEPIHGAIIAEMMAQMIIYKKKYHLSYSEEQEAKLAAVFRSFVRQQHQTKDSAKK